MPKKNLEGKPKKARTVNKPPYDVQIGDRMFANNPTPLSRGEVYRKMAAKTGPYLVDGVWKVMVEDMHNSSWYLEVPMPTWHVVGESQEPVESEPVAPPTLIKGDIVQLRSCPRYPSLEAHTAKLTGEPFEAFDKWQAPVKYSCSGSKTAIIDCSQMAFIGHSRSEIIVNKIRGRIMKLSRPAVITVIVLAVVGILFLVGVGNYNSLVAGNNGVDNSWAHVETQYQRRFDLIGNVVESVKGSQFQEQAVFKSIADARRQYQSAQASGNENGQARAASTIESNVALIPRLQEAYPELRSNEHVSRLITELQTTENGIADVRNDYNDTVTGWNNKVTRFPGNVFAGIFNFHKRALFKADVGALKAPKVNFDEVKQKQ